MNGAHDLGGCHGLGEIDRTQQVNFAAPWERTVFALTLACGMLGRWNLDQSRFAREQMHPAHYLGSSYYEHWLFGLERLLQQTGLLDRSASPPGTAEQPPPADGLPSAVRPEAIAALLRRGSPTTMQTAAPPGFQPGDRARVKNFHPHGHTRAPRYIRGREGCVQACYGAHVFPDRHAAEDGVKQPAYLYSMRFDAAELWGADAVREQGRCAVYVDVFEPYLEPADG